VVGCDVLHVDVIKAISVKAPMRDAAQIEPEKSALRGQMRQHVVLESLYHGPAAATVARSQQWPATRTSLVFYRVKCCSRAPVGLFL
jgi:hypothetical protein